MKPQLKKVLTFGGTFSVALGIGFVMQNGDALAARFSTGSQDLTLEIDQRAASAETMGVTGQMPAPVIAGMASTAVLPVTDVAPDLPDAPVQLVALGSDDSMSDMMMDHSSTDIAETCAIDMTATTGPAAMVNLLVSAPCQPDARYSVHHQGMIFTALTDDQGHSNLQVPALAEAAVFLTSFPDGDTVVATTLVPELGDFERVVLQWQGAAGLEIHAREFGADYGENGHIWHAAAGDLNLDPDVESGFLIRLGAAHILEPYMAEVYTFPSVAANRAGEIALSAEIEITDTNCGRDVAAQSLQLRPGFDTETLDLTLTLPACDAIGDFLVLNNMFEDLTLASR